MHKKTASWALACFLLFASVGFQFPERAHAQQSVVKWIPNLNHMIAASIDEPEASDPAWGYDTASAEMIFNVYETLIFWPYEGVPTDPADFQPMLAEEWVTPTGGYPGTTPYPGVHPTAPAGTVETWYFKIRPNVPYHDEATYGTVKPADVEYSIERAMVFDHIGGPTWMHYFPLLGLSGSLDWDTDEDGELSYDEAAVGGPLIDDAVESNSTHVWFNLAISYPPFMQILAQPWSSVYPQAWGVDLYEEGRFFWPKWGAEWDYVTPGRPGATPYDSWADFNDHTHPQLTAPTDQLGETKMIGTGPYKFGYWVKGDTYQLLKFHNYWRGWPGPSEASYVELFTHKLVWSWDARRAMFLSGLTDKQADIVDVPRAYIGQVEGEPGVRGVKDLPSLLLSPAMCFNYQVNPDAIYFTIKPKLGADEKPDLFSDKHMRKAFAHALDYGTYLVDAFLGEAIQPATPIVKGVAQYNATKQKYDYSLTKVQDELKLAWEGALEGSAWDQGFYVPLTYSEGNEERRIACEMIEDTMENRIPGTHGMFSVDVFSLPGGEAFIPAMKRGELTVFLNEWPADYGDADDFIVPFMHSTMGIFAKFQNVEYVNINASDFAPNAGRADPTTGAYRNWEGKVWNIDVFGLNNTYVQDLIEQAATGTPAQRLAMYSELEDIYYAVCASVPLAQPLVRHWERDWVQGWYYNPMHPVLYVYHLWKGLDADINGDLRVDDQDLIPIDMYYFEALWVIDHWEFIYGTEGVYNRVADISSPFEVAGEPRTWELDGDEIEWYHYGLIPGYALPGVDGYVNLYDQALVIAQSGTTVGRPPDEAMQSLITTIESWNLPTGTENALTSKLDAAIDLFQKNNFNGAVHKLEDFISRVEALRDKKLTDEQADYLVASAQACINTILSMP